MVASLDVLFRASPERAMREALDGPATDDTARFLKEHASHLLTLEQVAKAVAIHCERHPGETPPVTLVERCADLLVSISHPQPMLMALWDLWPLRPDATRGLGKDGWRELVALTRKRGLPEKWWWWLVDWTRGCPLYDALAKLPRTKDPMPRPEPGRKLTEREQEVSGHLPWAFRDFEWLAENASPPLVLDLLESPTDEARVREHLTELPLAVLLELHGKGLISQEDVERIASERASAPSREDVWPTPLPRWLATQTRARASHCGYPEDLALTRWLDEDESGDLELLKLGYVRYLAALGVERDPIRLNETVHEHGAYWAKRLGGALATGTAWKGLGREIIELSVDANRGFPQHVLRAAIAAIVPSPSATREVLEKAILRRTHDVTAGVFLERARNARERREWGTVERFLAALSELDCGTFVAPHLHKMAKPLPNDDGPIPDGVVAWLEACRSIAKSGGRDPTEEGLIAAFEALLVRPVSS